MDADPLITTLTTAQDVAAAVERVQNVLRRRPETGLHDDAPASARWVQGTRVVASHANGTSMATDMPTELGGTGDQVSPGWLFRAGIASCTATLIAMTAASVGITLTVLEVRVGSRTDMRGMFGMHDAAGEPVPPGPSGLQMQVRIGAPGIAAERLRSLVADSVDRSPIASTLPRVTPLALQIDVA